MDVSYRFDAMSVVITPKLSLIGDLSDLGYEIRMPEKTDELRSAKGYSKSDAKIIRINNKDFTLNTRAEWRLDEVTNKKYMVPDSGFIAFSGNDLDDINVPMFLGNLKDISYCTRFDIACDMVFKTDKKLMNKQNKLCEAVGFSADYENGNKQNPINDIRAGLKNGKTAISSASKTVSNGLTLYIGSRSSKFMSRCYNKTEEVLKRTGEMIEPTLRVEHEIKQEYAEACRKLIINSTAKHDEMAKMAWHNFADDSISFAVGGKDEPISMGEFLGLGKARAVTLDYSKMESKSLEYEYWVKSSVAPKFSRVYNDLSLDDKVQKALQLMLSDEDLSEYYNQLG